MTQYCTLDARDAIANLPPRLTLAGRVHQPHIKAIPIVAPCTGFMTSRSTHNLLDYGAFQLHSPPQLL